VGQSAKEHGRINNFQNVFDFVINSNAFHDFATSYSFPVEFGQGTRTNLRDKFNLLSSK